MLKAATKHHKIRNRIAREAEMLEARPENLDDERLHVGGLEGVFESGHLVEHTAGAPDVALVVVRLLLGDLRRQVVRRANARARECVRAAERLGDPEVAHLHAPARHQEHVLRAYALSALLEANAYRGGGKRDVQFQVC